MASFEEEMKTLCAKHGKDVESVLKKEEAAESIEINPQDVRKVVVEHVIKQQDQKGHGSSSSVYRRKLRLFSGKKPTPSGEVNFASWRVSAKQIVDDEDMSERDKNRGILDSLLIPALTMVKNVPPKTSADTILNKLVKVYGSTRSGDDMMFDFFELYQQSTQSASDYLENLYTEIMSIVDEAPQGLIRGESEQLLSQFLRGCWDEELITKLKLEDMKGSAPDFEVLFERIKKEELKREQKNKRKDTVLKGKKAQQQNIAATSASNDSEDLVTEQHQFKSHMDKKYEDLNKRITALEEGQKATLEQLQGISKQLNSLDTNLKTSTQSSRFNSPPASGASSRFQGSSAASPNTQSTQNRPTRFCFNCGIDNHHMERCRNSPNPALVGEKVLKRAQENAARQPHLNE